MRLLKETFEIDESLRDFLRRSDIIEALDNDDFNYIYTELNKWHSNANNTSTFTTLILKTGDNPLNYMDYIPKYFLFHSNITEFVVPSNITYIQKHAFGYCNSLTSINLSNCKNLTRIDEYAFDNCRNLTDVALPNGLINIGYGAFGCCASLVNIDIPNSVTHISQYAFVSCANLVNVRLSDNLNVLNNGAFGVCERLTEIDLSNCTKLTNINTETFTSCKNLSSVILPNSITHIGDDAFYNCGHLKDLIISSDIENFGDGAFYGCYDLTLHVPKKFSGDKWVRMSPSYVKVKYY